MEVFAVKILTSLLVIALMTTSVLTGRVHNENKNDNKGRALDTKNCTKDECEKDVAGDRRCALYILHDPEQLCYTKYFVRRQPPVGLRTGNTNLKDIRYICQPPPLSGQHTMDFYATMFDEGRGIAVFSAYTLENRNLNHLRPVRELDPKDWDPTPGITRQGSQGMYRRQPYQKGHLVPAKAFSDSQTRYDSTFTFTNSVPQRENFNKGGWKRFEMRILQYAVDTCTQPRREQPAGILYLLTGTSFARIDQHWYNPPRGILGVDINRLGSIFGPYQPIDIPNSLWTAGCCVRRDGRYTRSFAVMGNNVVKDDPDMRTIQLTVRQLQNILVADVRHHNIGGPTVNLFPGDANCFLHDLNRNLPGSDLVE